MLRACGIPSRQWFFAEFQHKEKNNISAWWFKVTFLGWLIDPFKGSSDLQLGDEKGTLNHLV